MRRRWHCQGSASAHMIAVGEQFGERAEFGESGFEVGGEHVVGVGGEGGNSPGGVGEGIGLPLVRRPPRAGKWV